MHDVGMSKTMGNVSEGHASEDTKLHCVYMHCHLGFSFTELGRCFRQHRTTIAKWAQRYLRDGHLRKSRRSTSRFTSAQRQWILDYNKHNPVSFLDETRSAFATFWSLSVGTSTIGRIVREANLTYKVILSVASLHWIINLYSGR